MKSETLLIGINAKYIHSNLAIRYLKKYVQRSQTGDIDLMEFSINQSTDYILNEIILKEPKLVAFSCYLWNIEIIRKLSRSIKLILPMCRVIYGGPEVSYTSISELQENPFVDSVIKGEGEETFLEVYQSYILETIRLEDIQGITYRNKGVIVDNDARIGMDLDKLPFPYDKDMDGLEHRILYYETSRGCPFQCQYCLSSIEKGVRFKSLDKVYEELDFFLGKKVRQVKFVDRTFNARREHAHGIMTYIIEHDNGVTNFHFEVAPELIHEEFIEVLTKARDGLFQLEIGIQSMNEKTLKIIRRRNNANQIQRVMEQIKAMKNTHVHLDLIAGLPEENYESFATSFDFVYHLKPDQLQLGFLKVLKGAGMNSLLKAHQIEYRNYPPYEVLQTGVLAYGELEKLKVIEEMVELFYNSGNFLLSIEYIIGGFASPFSGFESLANAWIKEKMHHHSHSKLELYDFIYEYTNEHLMIQEHLNIQEQLNIQELAKADKLGKLVAIDYCLKEKPKKVSDWMSFQLLDSALVRMILDSLESASVWKEESGLYTTKQRSRMYHIDGMEDLALPKELENCQRISFEMKIRDGDVPVKEEYKGLYLVINYLRRDFLHHNGECVLVEIK